jgi:hypothetical protein
VADVQHTTGLLVIAFHRHVASELCKSIKSWTKKYVCPLSHAPDLCSRLVLDGSG